MKQLTVYILGISSLFLFNTCARNPVTGKKQVVFMSEAQEIQMGQEADPQIIAQYGLYDDNALQAFMKEKGKAMAAISHRPNIEYNFRIVDSEVLNAFAVPGGYVYFTRGIMAYLNDEAQFAGVLGHEIGHIAARHTVAQQRNQILGQLGIIAGVVLAPDLARFAETASQGLGLLLLKFGREAETQADELGVEYSTKINYDAKEMADFFLTLKRQSASQSEELPTFLSTHPDPGNRYATVNKLAVEWKAKLGVKNPVIARNEYLRRIDGMVFGEDPRQGYLENDVFYHPGLKFQFSVPQGWNYQNTPQRVQVAPKDGKALMFMTLAKGTTPEEAATTTLQAFGLQATESKKVFINGLPALRVYAAPAQQQQGQEIRTVSTFIQYGGKIYLMLGVSSFTDFTTYQPYFLQSMQNFRELTDLSKINKKPQRVRTKTVNSASTLEQSLKSFGVPAAKMEEMAVLNGMQLTTKLSAGTLIKVVSE